MKRSIINLAMVCLTALVATGCTTMAEQAQKNEHKSAMLDKRISATERANAVAATPACQIVGNDSGTITMSGVKSFTCYGAQPERQAIPQEAADEKSGWQVAGEMGVEVIKVLANPVATVLMNSDSQKTARHNSDNGVRMQAINMGTLGNVATAGFTQIGETAEQGINKPMFVIAPAAPAPVAPAAQ